MKLTEMKQILSERQIQLTRSLGQNFLHDHNQLHRIAAAAEITNEDPVLEIGPGLGPLTEVLLAQARHVLAIEKDRRLVEVLQPRFAAAKNLTLLHDDALDYVKREKADWSDWKLVANLPYSVASPILVELAQAEQSPRLMVVTLQSEVAQRIVAQTDDDAYGLLSLLLQVRYEPRGSFNIPPSCFFPEPDVESACIALARRPVPLLTLEQEKTFTKIAKRGFSQRRKMFFKLLKGDWAEPRLREVFERLNLSAQIRAEAVSLDQFVQMTQLLHGGA